MNENATSHKKTIDVGPTSPPATRRASLLQRFFSWLGKMRDATQVATPPPTPQPSSTPQPPPATRFPPGARAGETRTVTLPGGAKLELVWCPPGTFTMGSPAQGRERWDWETPYEVTLTQGFWLGRYPVTQRQWRSVMGTDPSFFRGDDRPVECVSWKMCQAFCRRAGLGLRLPTEAGLELRLPTEAGLELRLPTEAEWEYACRAGTEGSYAGTGRLDDMGWHEGNSGGGTHPVGRKAANAWGLCDMHGNVWEWCADRYGDCPYSTVRDPTGSAWGGYRVNRGGSWIDYARSCRAAFRLGCSPDYRSDTLGFRVALAPPPPAPPATQLPPGERVGETRTVTLPGGAELELVWCPPGTFTMGSPATEEGREDWETQHEVTLTRGFWLGKYPVTQRQWASVTWMNLSCFKGDDRPVVCVSWKMCQAFCRRAGLGLRLPTEAEWEYACRAGTETAYFWGDALNGDRANCDGNYPCGTRAKGPYKRETTPVGAYAANAWGLHDMHGNVWEWCADWYGAYPSGAVTDPTGAASGVVRVNRGGSWLNDARDCRSANRYGGPSGNRYSDRGFRLACSAGPYE